MAGIPDVQLAPGQRLDGFEVVDVTRLPNLRAVAYRLLHARSGARLLHLHTFDDENLFSVSFPTLPRDHSGAAHILEHSVLSGSVRFPVRDPFFEMVKMSMATFINAMTGWDCTYYPVASNVKRDLFNLADVYFDAVFHPLLTEETFQREGHHLALANDGPDAALAFRGIVFNEMKGVFSDPKSRMYRRMTRQLFPDSVYGMESGGDPLCIPDLTWQGLVDFHRTFYHPGNAYFVMYGDIPTADHTAFLRDRLAPFEHRPTPFKIVPQPRWSKPIRVEECYPVGRDEDLAEKTFLGIHWLTGLATDVDENTLFNLLDLVLLGHDAAPLKKALVDSRLGHDVLYSGTSPVGLENTFCVGIKGSEVDRVEAFEQLVFGTLERIADEEIDADEIETAFRQAAYNVREITSQYPVMSMERVLESWIYGGDALSFLRLSERLDACRARLRDNPRLFNHLIRDRLLNNPHRLTAVFRPDPEASAREDAQFAERLERIRAGLTAQEIERIAANARQLEAKSGTPNSPQALATLPQLRVHDLPASPKHIANHVTTCGGFELIRCEVFANGVTYLALDFDLTGLADDLWRYLPFFTDAIEKMGTTGRTYEETARRVAATTGGISCAPYFDSTADASATPLLRLRLRIKTLDEQVPEALDVLHDLLFDLDPRDRERLEDVVSQSRAWVRNHLVHQGSATATRHAGRGFSLQGELAERVYGLPQLELVERIHTDFDQEAERVVAKILEIRDFLPRLGRVTVSVTGSDDGYARIAAALAAWSTRMRPAGGPDLLRMHTSLDPAHEGLAGPIQVAHCALVMPAPHFSHPDSHLLTLGSRILGLDYFINEIRFKGNAYGASCSYAGFDQVLCLGSYRDPHIVRTLRVFENLQSHVQSVNWSEVEIERAIIGTAKHDGQPIRPGGATSLVLSRHLRRFTDEMREERYRQLLGATPAAVKDALLQQLERYAPQSAVCVVSSQEKLEEANRELARPLTIHTILD